MLQFIDRLVRALALYCGGGVLVLMLALIVVDVAGRYAFNAPVFGALDLYGFLLALIVACCLAYGGRTGAHVSADMFAHLATPAVERAIAVLTKLLAAGVMTIWAWVLFHSGRVASLLGETTQLLNIPMEPIYFALGAGVALFALALFVEAARLALSGEVRLLEDESRAMGSPE